eukprot:GFYU01057349.1.p1 GENE.GFYU01057349.1~~GFYU01057349.1.p1  ORF type:complete len:192 (+),score=61.98 GFYU01057349.1:1-576(+)
MMKPSGGKEKQNEFSGVFLCFVSLIFDGLTGSYQDKIVASHKPSAHQMMYAMNLYAMMALAVYTLVSGELGQALLFVTEHPSAQSDLLLLAIFGSLGQNFIFYTITTFGSLFCSVVTTTRKFFTILASILWYGHALAGYQWMGVMSVFAGIMMNIYLKYQKAAESSRENKYTPVDGKDDVEMQSREREHAK